MSAPGDAFNLPDLDDAEPAQLDPQVALSNFAALRIEQPEFTDQLDQAPLPANWRPVRALDGFTTYRTEALGQPAAWLAGTAAPLTRAAGLLAGLQPADQNLSLPSIAAGAELQWLLTQLPRHGAVYVFETEIELLAAVLRSVDVAAAITSGRCVLVPPQQEHGFLSHHLAAYPGLLPPGNIVVLPGVTSERIEHVRGICQSIAQQTHEARNRRMSELAARAGPDRPASLDTPRVAILALTPDPLSQAVGVSLERAARDLGWEALRCAVGGPRDVHLVAHCEALATFPANLMICLNHSPAAVPLRLRGTVCEWFATVAHVPEKLPADDVLRLAASPRVLAALRAAALPGAHLGQWYWACEPVEPTDDPVPENTVLLVCDLPDDDPAACGIDQPTHVQLWQQARARAAQLWQNQTIPRPADLLRDAERAVGARVGEAVLHRHLLGVLERVLIPRVIAETIAQTLEAESFEVRAVGQGWERCTDHRIDTLAEHLFTPPRAAGQCRPLAAVFTACPDPLTPALLQAGALGWPLLIYAPAVGELAADLGDILRPEQHVQTFAGSRELRAALTEFRHHPQGPLRRAQRAQEHLRESHSYPQRLRQLVQLVRAAEEPPCA